MTQGRLREAQEQADLMLGIIQKLGRDGYLQEAHLGLSIVLLASGDLKKALAECESGDSGRRFEQRHIRSLILKTVILAKMKEFENASLTAEQLQRELEEYYKNIASRNPFAVYYNLLGIIELEKDNFDRAAENCLLAKSLFPVQHSDDYILFIDPLAEAYYKSGDWDGARQTYELASSLTFGRYQWGHLYAKSFLMLGKIHEELGNKEAAIENYKKFIDLWKDCDPQYQPMVEDAGARLSRLQDE
jgi:tetratricopeptide (TPR) repeat protein